MSKFKHGNLGEIISNAVRLKICQPSVELLPPGCRYDGAVQVGNFIFGSHSHDTGISVHVYVRHPVSFDPLEIINACYWKSESSYGHNKTLWESGMWDDALGEAVDVIKEKIAIAEAGIADNNETYLADLARTNKEIKDTFESLF